MSRAVDKSMQEQFIAIPSLSCKALKRVGTARRVTPHCIRQLLFNHPIGRYRRCRCHLSRPFRNIPVSQSGTAK